MMPCDNRHFLLVPERNKRESWGPMVEKRKRTGRFPWEDLHRAKGRPVSFTKSVRGDVPRLRSRLGSC